MGISRGLVFEDIHVGLRLPALVKGPMTSMHIMRWSAAMENWHRIHYDRDFAVGHDGLPGVLVNGSWKQHVLMQLVKDWIGHTGWVVKIGFQFRAMDPVGNTIRASGVVTEVFEKNNLGWAHCDLVLQNQEGTVTTPGYAMVVVPKREGSPVPYPFDLTS